MNILKPLAILMLISSSWVSCTEREITHGTLAKATVINLSRLSGSWHVPARIPTFLDRHARDMKIEITPAADGSLNLTWSFQSESNKDSRTTWRLTSTLSKPDDTTSWLVSPFWPVRFHFQVIEYSADYSWVIIGSSDRKRLWVLSRDQELPQELMAGLFSRLESAEFNLASIVGQNKKTTN